MKKHSLFLLSRSLVLVAGFLVMNACNMEPSRKKIPQAPAELETSVDSLELKEPKKEKPPLVITYHLDSLKTAVEVDSFSNRFSPEEQSLIFALNRMDARRLNAGDVLVVPDSLTGSFMDYSPFPEVLEILDSIPQSVLISRRTQSFALYEQGNLLKWGPVSSGKQSTPTPAGLHYGNHKAQRKVSTVNPDWILPYYFNFMNFEGVGVHQYSMPGYPASHACVRLRMDDAKYIYDWARQWELNENGQVILRNGTPFMVFGDYDFEGQPPWLQLALDPKSNFLTTAEKDTLKNYVLKYKKDPRNFAKKEQPEVQLASPSGNAIKTLK